MLPSRRARVSPQGSTERRNAKHHCTLASAQDHLDQVVRLQLELPRRLLVGNGVSVEFEACRGAIEGVLLAVRVEQGAQTRVLPGRTINQSINQSRSHPTRVLPGRTRTRRPEGVCWPSGAGWLVGRSAGWSTTAATGAPDSPDSRLPTCRGAPPLSRPVRWAAHHRRFHQDLARARSSKLELEAGRGALLRVERRLLGSGVLARGESEVRAR